MVKTVYLEMPPGATVLDMLKKFQKKKGIPIHEMKAWFNNVPLEEGNTLESYRITNGTHLDLKTYARYGDCLCEECKRMEKRVTIKVTGVSKTIKVECKLGEPVQALKNAIRRMEGIAVAKQKLTYNDVELLDHRLLASYNFGDVEAGDAVPEVYLLVGGGDSGVFDKLRSMVAFKGTKSAPDPST